MSDAVNLRMLAFGVLGIALAGVTFAVSAAIAGTRADLRSTLERAGRGRGAFRAGGWLLGGQAAVAIVVIVAAVFMVTSFRRLANVDLGFEPDGLYRTLLLGRVAGESPAGLRARYDVLMDRLAARQDFAVAAADSLPWTGEAPITGLTAGNVDVALRGVSREFLDVNRARLVSGRWPTADEFRALAPVGVINRAGAAALWPSQSAVGRVLSAQRSRSYEIVGVVEDLKSRYDTGATAELFVPLDLTVSMSARFLVRSSLPAGDLATPLTEAARSVNPDGRATVVLTPAVDDLDVSLRLPRLVAGVFALFAVIVLVVSAAGITGLLMYFVEQRRYEMGVRLALGASRRAVSRLVARRALVPVAAGLVAGLGAAWWASRFVESLFFEVRATDVRLYLTGVAILAGLALVAAVVPARRASRVDPLIVMRAE
jgi:ABC-type antimicrobial peptide transport system permease subunit